MSKANAPDFASSADDLVAKEQKSVPRRILNGLKKFGSFLLAQWLLIGFGICCLLGYLFPDVAAHGGYIKSEYSILYGAVGFIFLVSGLQLSTQKLRINLTNWRLHILVQGMSFLVVPVFMFVFVYFLVAVGAVRSRALDPSILVGMIAVGCVPTTIASNVVMTRAAGGDEAAAIVEVVLGNTFGTFISPFLIFGMIPNDPSFDEWRPASPSSLSRMYGDVAKQIGLAALLPLCIGQVIRFFFEKQTQYVVTKFYLAKASTFCLILLAWSTFSGAFKTGAFDQIPKPSLIFNIFMNIVLYIIFTLICFFLARPPALLISTINPRVVDSRFGQRLPEWFRRIIRVKQMPKVQAIAVCFCGAAKTASLGIPLVAAMWSRADDLTRAYIQIPVLLYTIEQIFMAQSLVYFFRWYLNRPDRVADAESDQESSGSVPHEGVVVKVTDGQNKPATEKIIGKAAP